MSQHHALRIQQQNLTGNSTFVPATEKTQALRTLSKSCHMCSFANS